MVRKALEQNYCNFQVFLSLTLIAHQQKYPGLLFHFWDSFSLCGHIRYLPFVFVREH